MYSHLPAGSFPSLTLDGRRRQASKGRWQKMPKILQLHSPRQSWPLSWEAAGRVGGCWSSNRGNTTHFWTELGRIPAFNYIQLSICPCRRHQIRNSKPEGCPGRNVSSASRSDPEGGRNLVMDLQQSGIGSGAKTPGICPPPNTPLHVHSGQSTAGQIGAGGGHRTQPIQGHEASQLSQSPSASCSQQLWKQLCSKLR